MKKTTTILLLLFSCFVTQAQIQRTNHWYFGGGAGIDFSNGQAVADTNSAMDVYAGCATMSDENGNLLFYTNGFTVWNRQHQVMQNGTALAPGNSTPFQSSVIVPKPGNKDIYYIFHLRAFNWKADTMFSKLMYSIVDMSLDNGLGAVTIKGVPLLSPVSEALGAVMHANCNDVWIMAHKRGTNDFYAYLLTENGITDSVINTIGNFAATPYGPYGLKFSPDGSKMASNAPGNYINDTSTFDTLHLFDFERTTGILSNKILIPDTIIGAYGFSPDNKKLYMHQGYMDAFTYQLDISSNNQVIVLSTKTLIYYDSYYNQTDFQNTVDNKVIAAVSFKRYVSIINNPNNSGVSCNMIDSALYLNGRYCYVSLPNFVQSYFDTDTSTSCFNSSIIDAEDKKNIKIFPNPFSEHTSVIIEGVAETDNISLALYNIIGEEQQLSYKQFYDVNSLNIQIFRNNLPGGIYYLNFKHNNVSVLEKLIILN